jgi:cation:H+ antiporter
MPYLMLALGLILLFAGGETLVRGSVALALRLGISKLVVAVVLVGFGTSVPEVLVSIESAALGHPELALGNAVGSNIANILLIIGLSAAIYPIAVERKEVGSDTWLVALVTLAFVVAGLAGNLSVAHGVAMIAALGLYVGYVYRRSRHSAALVEAAADTVEPDLSLAYAIVYTLIGLSLVIVGADLLVDGAVRIARQFGISEAVIGLTIVAVGSSLPELATCISAARRREPLVAVGNVLGSNIFNLLGAVGVVALITDIRTTNAVIVDDLLIMLAVTAVLAILLLYVYRIGRPTGYAFLGAYAVYVGGAYGMP